MAQQYNGVHYCKDSLGTYVEQLSIYLYKTVHKKYSHPTSVNSTDIKIIQQLVLALYLGIP